MGVAMIYVFLARRPGTASGSSGAALIDYIGAGEVLLSGLLRWVLLPRLQRAAQAFVVFIIGIALADGCAFLGIFLSARPTELFALGVLGIVQWAPIFVGKFSNPAAGRETGDFR
jgi:hypothetical protein